MSDALGIAMKCEAYNRVSKCTLKLQACSLVTTVMTQSAPPTRLRLLALHSFRTTGSIFREQVVKADRSKKAS